MRVFPRAGRLAAALSCVVVGVVLLSPTLPSSADEKDRLEQEKREVQREQKAAAEDLEHSSAGLRKASSAYEAARKKLERAQARVEELSSQLVAARAAHTKVKAELAEQKLKLAEAKRQLAAGKAEVKSQRQEMRDAILSRFTGGDPQLAQAAALLSGGSLEDLMRQQTYVDAASAGQDATLQRMEATETMLVVREREVQEATDAVAAQEKKARELVAEVDALRDQAAAAEAETSKLAQKAAAAKQSAAAAKAADAAELRKLEAEESALRTKIRGLSKRGSSRNVGSVGGLFAAPVSGTYVTSPYGMRTHPIYGYVSLHNGTDFHAPCGRPLRAVESGQIISTNYSSVWGNRLHLYLGKVNGHSYTAVYNHISSYARRSGSVGRGETVAYAGTTGWSTGCHLHFTILRDGAPVDPMPLLGL
ncbi:murein DD-endopeptidase MepM/ murein hydrolase activator NlpD [Nocardioides luteus]|uniref:Metalloendopeptidase n=1 Tax=Nocardioides luteus TaxID=1844 RepID=A0ABQ5T574_9ACTN|nr:M23 family metallopeptidase [Nocardioides luteus]MDR7309568.1 murein DD-endopeptidase MepM/ murein hydrolase activator NlpD [Nocardioides luteus]GGR52113.1 metalloendopeptidase [Nocardioides luteus]GLJ70649.1 metalloendopeptidase [Nocardioides luteus]